MCQVDRHVFDQSGYHGQMRSADPTPSGAALTSPRAIRTRHLLRERATDLFLRQGVNATTTMDIVDAAGVSRSTFYSYYSDKSDLLIEIAGAVWDGFGQVIVGLAGIERWSKASLRQYLGQTVAPYWEANRPLLPLLGEYYGDEDVYRERIGRIVGSLGASDSRWRQGDEVTDELRLHLVVAAFVAAMSFRLLWPGGYAGNRDLDLLAEYLHQLVKPTSGRVLDTPWRAGRVRPRGEGDQDERGARERPKGTGLREGQKRQTHDAILDAAARLYAEQGYAGTVVDDIVRVIGASRATFYLHFPDKAATLTALGERQWQERTGLYRQLGQLSRWTPQSLGSWIADDIDSWPTKSYMTSLMREDRHTGASFRGHVEQILDCLVPGDGATSLWDQMHPDERSLRSRVLVLNVYLVMHHWAFWDWTAKREHVIRAVGGACSLLLTRAY
jgi:AcrR family transcriptional regulator